MCGNIKVLLPKNIKNLELASANGNISIQNFETSKSILSKVLHGTININNCNEISAIQLKSISEELNIIIIRIEIFSPENNKW